MESGYLRKNVEKITGVKASTVQQYTDKGLISASIDNPIGRGTNRLYSVSDMVELMVCRKLVETGVKHKDLVEIMNFARFKEHIPPYRKDFKFHFVVINPGTKQLRVKISKNNTNHNENILSMNMDGVKNAIIIDVTDILQHFGTLCNK